jgi:flagellar biosynthesis/type III secretory pathway protein FliH
LLFYIEKRVKKEEDKKEGCEEGIKEDKKEGCEEGIKEDKKEGSLAVEMKIKSIVCYIIFYYYLFYFLVLFLSF